MLSTIGIVCGICYSPQANAEDGNTSSRQDSVKIDINTETNSTSSTKDDSDGSNKKDSSSTERSDRRTSPDSPSKEKRLDAKGKLSATKLQICKDRKATIEQRASRITQRTTKHLELFDSIAERTQAFYISSGSTVENYDTLANDIATKRITATVAIDSLNAQNITIDCEGVEPKTIIATYKESLRLAIEALRDYRTAIKNLIVAVKTAQAATPDTTDDTNKEAQ
jgi:hypothetical protein